MRSYHGDHTAGPDAIPHAHHAHVVGVLAPPHEVLVAHVVGAVVHHEAASLHPAGVAPAQVGGHVWAVAHALIGATLEVPLLVEDDLRSGEVKGLVSTREEREEHTGHVFRTEARHVEFLAVKWKIRFSGGLRAANRRPSCWCRHHPVEYEMASWLAC